MPPEPVEVPADLTRIENDQELHDLRTAAEAEFAALQEGEVTADTLERAMHLTDDIVRLRTEIKIREDRAEAAAAREAQRLAGRMADLRTEVGGEPETIDEEGNPVGTTLVASQLDYEAIAAAAARGVAAVLVAQQPGRPVQGDLATRINTSLSDASRHAPPPNVPATPLVVTASVDIPGYAQGAQLEFDDVVDAVQKRARAMSVSDTGNIDGGARVVTIRNQFEHTLDDRTSLAQVEELFRELTSEDKQDALVAGGGWCAPSEVRYNFFNIACEDGLVDLPTFGVTRGGIKFPISPSLADAQLAPFVSGFSNTSNPWLWTETDDQATVTGVPNKPCVRVPCPTFDERRLECYGICLTAGNLTDDAYPEATANFLRLLMAAHSHAMNARVIATMVGLSSAAVTAGDFGVATSDPVTQLLGGIELGATDYRERYGMCYGDVLEVVLPRWVQSVLRAALRHRQGIDRLAEADGVIRALFAALNVRAQFVGDWQVRGASQFGNATAMNAWPTTVDAMIYAAGTFVLGNGLTLDLGVVRDSALNAENDFTAAWSEECHLVARVGHESRQYRIQFGVGYTTAPTAPSTPPVL